MGWGGAELFSRNPLNNQQHLLIGSSTISAKPWTCPWHRAELFAKRLSLASSYTQRSSERAPRIGKKAPVNNNLTDWSGARGF